MPRGLRAPAGGVTVAGKTYGGGQYLPTGPEVSVWWNGVPLKRGLETETEIRVGLAMRHLRKKIRKNISRKGGRGDHSKKGEFPKMISGDLRKGIRTFTTKTGSIVYGYATYSEEYGQVLETSLERPFISRTFEEELPKMKAIMGAPM